MGRGSASSSSSSSSGITVATGAAAATAATAAAAATDAGDRVLLDEETSECPICFEEIRAGDAAMRCAGHGGMQHYFHASCLQHWIRSSRTLVHDATCPMCRGSLQFNGQRLNEFLGDQAASAGLSQDERDFLTSI